MKNEFGVVGSWELSRVKPVQELGPGRVRSRAEPSRVESSRGEPSRVEPSGKSFGSFGAWIDCQAWKAMAKATAAAV